MLRGLVMAIALLMTSWIAVSAPLAQSKAVESTIKSVDAASGTITLADGTRLVIPKTLLVPSAQLKPGAKINADYEEKGGQKVARSIQIKG